MTPTATLHNIPSDRPLLTLAQDTWQAAEPLRRLRRRHKDFAYGRQWTDTLRDATGRIITEQQKIIDSGRLPITNNLIRQLIKSIVGRYRHLTSPNSADPLSPLPPHPDPLSETDARALEEFLISGCAIQRISPQSTPANVSLEKFIFPAFQNPDASDARLLGMLHDIPLPEIIRRFSQGSTLRAKTIKQTYSDRIAPTAPAGIPATPSQTHPFIVKFYPLIDGEVHSLVEDVIDQQKYINRLITLLDSIIAASAKGVLLYPTDQLPEGFTWRDIRKIWSSPDAIIPFKRTSKNITPQQILSPATSQGASDMLRLQLQLFDEISGATGAIRGKSPTASGAEMLRTELQNSTISLLDILTAFHSFITTRNTRLAPHP